MSICCQPRETGANVFSMFRDTRWIPFGCSLSLALLCFQDTATQAPFIVVIISNNKFNKSHAEKETVRYGLEWKWTFLGKSCTRVHASGMGIGMGWSDVGTSNCSLVYLYLYYIVTRALCRRCLSVVLQHQQHNNYTKTKGWLSCGGRKVDGILKFRWISCVFILIAKTTD